MARIVTDGTAYVNLSQVDTGATQKLGQSVQADSGVYEYFQANGAISEGGVCILTYDDGQAVEADTTASGSTPKSIGIACEALADNEYGWFWRGKGYENVLLAASVADDAAITTTATAGEGGTGGDLIFSLISTAANGGSVALTACAAGGLLTTNS